MNSKVQVSLFQNNQLCILHIFLKNLWNSWIIILCSVFSPSFKIVKQRPHRKITYTNVEKMECLKSILMLNAKDILGSLSKNISFNEQESTGAH